MELDHFNTDSVKADNFIEIVRHYSEFKELTTPMLNEFIHKIMVHEADKSSGERVQQVDIYFNFIGNFVVLAEDIPLTAEELEEQEKLRQKRAKQREANHRWYAKKKAETQRRHAEEAGELPPSTPEEIEMAERKRFAQKQAEKERTEQRRQYKRDWAKQNRRKKRADKTDNNTETVEEKE